ncbi:MAG: transposase [Coprococcus phoceensis]
MFRLQWSARHKEKCLYKYDAEKDAEKNKVMKINEQWEALKEESHGNIQSEKGILNRQIRSIQTEGHFGDIKENDNFRRFNCRTAEKVYKEFMLYAIGRNINKYHRFLHEEIKKFEEKLRKRLLRKRVFLKMQLRSFCALKYIPKRKNTNLL